MTEINISNALCTEEPLIRPAKRRKFYRKHNAEDVDNSVATPTSSEHSTALPLSATTDVNKRDSEAAGEDEESHRLTMTEILRRRQAARNRRGGIEFTNSNTNTKNEGTPPAEPATTTVEKGDPARELQTVVNRFAPQTGQVADVDKHM